MTHACTNIKKDKHGMLMIIIKIRYLSSLIMQVKGNKIFTLFTIFSLQINQFNYLTHSFIIN